MKNWLSRNLERGIEWFCDAASISIQGLSSGPSIYISPEPESIWKKARPTIALHIIYRYGNRFEIGDLLGNGDGSGWENKKYGTLAVNLGIQVLRALYADRLDEIEVHGKIVPDVRSTSPAFSENVKRRNYFWSRFGFVLSNPDAPETTFQAKLSELECVDRGDIAAGLSSCLPIDKFWTRMNTPRLLKSDIEALAALNFTGSNIATIPDSNALKVLENDYKEKLDNNYKIYSALVTTALLATLTSSKVIGLIPIAIIIFAFSMVLFLFKASIKNKFKFYLEDRDIVRKLESFTYFQQETKVKIDSLLVTNSGIFGRLKAAASLTSKKHKEFFSQLYDSNINLSKSEEGKFYLSWYKAICIYKEELGNKVNSNHMSPYSEANDYIFGAIYDSMDIDGLEGKANQLNDQFEHHLNRLIRTQNGRLKLHGASYADPRTILEKLSNVAKIEIYSSGNAADYNMNLMQMRVMLQEGFLDFVPTWTIWKEIRAKEVVDVLHTLVDLNLAQKTFITGNSDCVKAPNDLLGLTLAVFDLLTPKLYSDEAIKGFVETKLKRIGNFIPN